MAATSMNDAGNVELIDRPGDRDAAVLERLAEVLEDPAAELRKLVEEEHPVMGQAHLARPRDDSAADEARRR